MLNITPIPIYDDNYVWIIETNDHCWVVDPGDHKPVIKALIQIGKPLAGILVTHRHWDHITGIQPLWAHFSLNSNSPIPIYRPESLNLPCPSIAVNEGDIINIASFDVSIMEIPGHTKDHIAFYIKELDTLFSGDTIFACGCGRLFDGSMEELYKALHKIKALPESTIIYCTHEYTLANIEFALAVEPNNQQLQDRQKHCQALRDNNLPTLPTTVKLEQQTNPFLRTEQPCIQQSVSKQAGSSITDCFSAFSELRLWKNRY